MVKTDMGLPDPDNPTEDLRITSETVFGISQDDSDQEVETEDFQIEFAQYQLLPASPVEETNTNSDSDDDGIVINNYYYLLQIFFTS